MKHDYTSIQFRTSVEYRPRHSRSKHFIRHILNTLAVIFQACKESLARQRKIDL